MKSPGNGQEGGGTDRSITPQRIPIFGRDPIGMQAGESGPAPSREPLGPCRVTAERQRGAVSSRPIHRPVAWPLQAAPSTRGPLKASPQHPIGGAADGDTKGAGTIPRG